MSGTSLSDLVIIAIAITVGAFIKGATGGGLPQVAIPVMAVFIGVERAVVLMAIPGVLSNGWLVWTLRDVRRQTRDLPMLLATGVVGAVIGTVLLKSLDGRILSAVLAAVVVLYVAIALLHPGFTLSSGVTRVASPPVGLAAGGLQGATGISGPLVTTYLHGFGLLPRAYVFSLAVMFFVPAVVQTITLAAVGLYTQSRLVESLLALIPIAIALPLGSRAARRLSPATFQKITLVLVAASGLSLIHDAFFSGGS